MAGGLFIFTHSNQGNRRKRAHYLIIRGIAIESIVPLTRVVSHTVSDYQIERQAGQFMSENEKVLRLYHMAERKLVLHFKDGKWLIAA